MLKVFGEWLQKKQSAQQDSRRTVARCELESLFHDELTQHALIAKSRRNAQQAPRDAMSA
jgi:hypothetical protein